jgi:hypothetical protein
MLKLNDDQSLRRTTVRIPTPSGDELEKPGCINLREAARIRPS